MLFTNLPVQIKNLHNHSKGFPQSQQFVPEYQSRHYMQTAQVGAGGHLSSKQIPALKKIFLRNTAGDKRVKFSIHAYSDPINFQSPQLLQIYTFYKLKIEDKETCYIQNLQIG